MSGPPVSGLAGLDMHQMHLLSTNVVVQAIIPVQGSFAIQLFTHHVVQLIYIPITIGLGFGACNRFQNHMKGLLQEGHILEAIQLFSLCWVTNQI